MTRIYLGDTHLAVVAVTVQSILQAAYPAYARQHPVAGHKRRAVRDMLLCGTGDLGVYIRRCPQGHFAEASGCSCRMRACPSCSGRRRMQWLDLWNQRLLPGLHLHTILTLPSQFHPLWRHNRRAMANLFFAVARQTLLTLAADPEHLGALPGILMVLHTWSRSLSLHPHLHLLVTGGGRGPDGHWLRLKRDFLVPVGVLRKVFRRLFLAAVETAYKDGRIALPPDWTEAILERHLRQLKRIKWNVCIKPPYKHGQGVVNYLGRYVMGGPIGQTRLRAFDGENVEFVVGREAKDPLTLRLPVEEFLRRWIEHIPESRLHTVRAYGLYASGGSARRESCRAEILASMPQRSAATPDRPESSPPRIECCPVCNATLVVEELRVRARRRHQPPVRAPATEPGREAA